mgnify:CR=1 FL=1
MKTVALLTISNAFMTFAWYGHLKYKEVALWKIVLISWGIAFRCPRIVLVMACSRRLN